MTIQRLQQQPRTEAETSRRKGSVIKGSEQDKLRPSIYRDKEIRIVSRNHPTHSTAIEHTPNPVKTAINPGNITEEAEVLKGSRESKGHINGQFKPLNYMTQKPRDNSLQLTANHGSHMSSQNSQFPPARKMVTWYRNSEFKNLPLSRLVVLWYDGKNQSRWCGEIAGRDVLLSPLNWKLVQGFCN